MTRFKQLARLHQARWRESKAYPIGTFRDREIGSLLAPELAEQDAQNFLGPRVGAAVRHRLAHREKHQQINGPRLWTNLLSSMPMCFNLFGELWHDLVAATKAVRTWFPDARGEVEEVRFEWSPGRLNPTYLNNRSAFDVAFLLKQPDGSLGAIGIETKHHEHAMREKIPGANRLPRYEQVTEKSKAFKAGWRDAILGTDLQQIWLDHLLALSMSQSGKWSWTTFVLVYPEGNVSFAHASNRYKNLLRDPSTFQTRTLEELLDASVLRKELEASFRERYLW